MREGEKLVFSYFKTYKQQKSLELYHKRAQKFYHSKFTKFHHSFEKFQSI